VLVFQLLVPATLLATQHGFSHIEKSWIQCCVSHGICSVKKFIDLGITCLLVTIPYTHNSWPIQQRLVNTISEVFFPAFLQI